MSQVTPASQGPKPLTISRVAGSLTAAMGLFVLAGWVFEIPWIKSVLPGAVEMKANTALSLLLAGIALGILDAAPSRRRSRIGQGLALIVAGIGSATAAEYAFGWQLGIDEALFRDSAGAFNAIRGRMSPYSAAVFTVIGCGLVAVPVRSLRWFTWGAAVFALLIGGVSLIGYLWHANELVTDQFAPPVALNTAISFLLLGVGTLWLKREGGVTAPVDPGPRSSIEKRTLIGFLSALVLLLCAGGYTYRAASDAAAAAQWVAHTQQVRGLLGRLYSAVSEAESSERNYILTGQTHFLEGFQRHDREANRNADDLARLIGDNPNQLQRLARLRATVDERFALLERNRIIFEQSGLAAAQGQIATGEGSHFMQEIRGQVQAMDAVEAKLLAAREASFSGDRSKALFSLVLTLGFTTTGFVVLFRGIRRELVSRTRAEEALRRAHAELDQASRLKDEFLANMSHELRTPLNAILGLSEALLEQSGGALTPRQAKSITTISASGRHLLELINDILDLSKIEAGKLELHIEPLPARDFCESCLAFVRTQAMEKRIKVAFQCDPSVARFLADPKRFKQVLVNLLTNAVKFTPEGGGIGLTVAGSEAENAIRFTVWDTGIGIASGDQKKLFRAFTQIDSGLARSQEGTGLGLALVARLMELHGGGVGLESEPGKGSRFVVMLPQTGRTAAEPVRQEQAERWVCNRALLIEDDPNASEQLERYLAELKITVVVHAHGLEAVEATLRERPDVILLDILLPNESGWVVLARLKEHPGTRDIPVVVISVVDEPQKSRALGAAAHFTKPVTREQLAGFLQRETVHRPQSASPFVEPGRGGGPLILLAEDNAANRETLGGYLEDKGYGVHYALNGQEAVQLARKLRPALILMDIQMPVMDGLAAMKEIRADPASKDTPIVALTALAMTGDRERCLAAGATDYMSKLVSLKALTAVVARLLHA